MRTVSVPNYYFEHPDYYDDKGTFFNWLEQFDDNIEEEDEE